MKRLFALILMLSLMLSGLAGLVSCGDDNGDDKDGNENENGDNSGEDVAKVDYSLTVVDGNGDGVEGILVTFRVGPKTSYTATTDDGGKAVINIEETSLPIRATIPAQLPSGYAVGEVAYVDFASGVKSASIEVVKNIAHTVIVKDSDGNAVAGANVQVCVDGVCQVALETDNEGKAVFYVNPDFEEAYAQFNTAPEGFAAPENAKIYYADSETQAIFVLDVE